MRITVEQLAEVRDFETLANFCHSHLGWPRQKWTVFSGIQKLYGIPAEELDGVELLGAVRKLEEDQKWGVFLVDYGDGPLHRSRLRSVLNKVAERARLSHDNPTWPHDNVLFICRSDGGTQFTLCHYYGDKPSTAKLQTFGWSDPNEARTALENICKLEWSSQADWSEAWDVERLTDTFFDELYQRFQEVEQLWKAPFTDDDRRTATQQLFNRLLFVCFLQKKGWLELEGGREDYLFRLYDTTDTSDPKGDSFSRKLELLFFSGLNSPNATPGDRALLAKEIGRVPFLNGGLFERNKLDSQYLPNLAYRLILGPKGLRRSYNFTIEESTPLDEKVAIDPEMLGKVFEELVNKRHDTGSYYTPRPIVAYMCREAIKGYLGGYEQLVDSHSAKGIEVEEARTLLMKLESVRFCDPACGSGAYLVGMLQEIFALQRLLDTASHNVRDDYARKKVIIENCLYGVDLEPFAVSIAWLRLWLALVIDNPQNPLDDPDADVALPNLDLKLEAGDSVASVDPQAAVVQTANAKSKHVQAGLDFEGVDTLVARYVELRRLYQPAHGTAKSTLSREIKDLKEHIKARVSVSGFSERAFLWPIEFPEVFLSDDPQFVKGFDIVLANPPYVRQETIKATMGDDYKKKLVASYPNTGSGTADLFVYFYDRGLQLLKPDGMFVYISSNKWFKSEYGKKLRKHVAKTATILSITDFGDLPVFKSALAYAMIFVARRSPIGDGIPQTPTFSTVKHLGPPYPQVKEVIESVGFDLPPDAIVGGEWTLADKEGLSKIRLMRKRGVPLGEYVKGRIYRGVVTGFNEAFFIDSTVRDQLVKHDPRSLEIIKPMVVGKDIRSWRAESNDRWMIFTRRGIAIEDYPAVREYLEQWRAELTPKSTSKDKVGRKSGRYKWYEIQDDIAYFKQFEGPKIAYQEIATYQAFAWLEPGVYTNNKVFQIFQPTPWLLGLLQSQTAWDYYQVVSTRMAGGALAMQVPTVASLPVPKTTADDEHEIEKIVNEILEIKSGDPARSVEHLQHELNQRIDFIYFNQRGEETYDQWKARTDAERDTEVGVLRELMKRGEDDTLEYKSSVIWDVDNNKYNSVMRDEVLKEICAFLNAEGGTILCGVDDGGNLLGLRKDLKFKGGKDPLGRVITDALGDLLKPHPVELVKIKFIEIDGETVLRIDVKPDYKHRYESPSTKKGEEGKNIPRTHVRIGASAKALEVGEAIAWWDRRQRIAAAK